MKQRITRILAVGSTGVLALASLFVFGFSGVAHATGDTLYWCNYGSSSNFGSSANWNLNGCGGATELPANGDILVFDNSGLTSLTNGLSATDDMPGLDLNSIEFSGTSGYSFNIAGSDSLTLDSGITDTTSTNQSSNTISDNIILNGGQTFDTSGADDNLDFTGNINLQNYNLTVNGSVNGPQVYTGSFSGSGALTFSGIQAQYITVSSPNFSGSTTIDSGSIVILKDSNLTGLGSGAITVNSGGSLVLESDSSSLTSPNSLNLSGSGTTNQYGETYGALVSCLGYSGGGGGLGLSGCTSAGNTTLTLGGAVSLAANAGVVNGQYQSGGSSAYTAIIDLTGTYSPGSFTLSDVPGTNTVLNLPATSSKTAPKAPDTGEALSRAKPSFITVGGTLIACSLVLMTIVFSRKLTKSSTKR